MRSLSAALLACLTLLLPATALADLGDLDPTFGAAANVVDPAGLLLPERDTKNQAFPDDAVRSSDGSTYVLSGNTQVIKLKPDGSRDTGWGDDGRAAITDPQPGTYGLTIESIAIGADGAVYGGGTRNVLGMPWGSYDYEVAAVRIGVTGVQDLAFGGDGVASFQGAAQFNRGHDIAAYDGGVVVVGDMNVTLSGGSVAHRMAAFAFTAAGTPNGALSSDGTPGLAFTGHSAEAFSVEVEPTDLGERIVMAGYGTAAVEPTETEPAGSESVWAVARIDESGQPDAAFGDGGTWFMDTALPGTDARSSDVDVVGDSVYVGGYVDYEMAVARLGSTGDPVAGFGDAGVSIVRLPDTAERGSEVRALEVDAQTGEVYIAGRVIPTGTTSWAIGVARLESDGGLDPVYLGGGGTPYDPSYNGAQDTLAEIFLLPAQSKKLLVVGATDATWPPEGDDPQGGWARRLTLMRLQSARTAPTNQNPPGTSGNGVLVEGDTITIDYDGVWSGYGTITYEYSWQRCTSSHGPTGAPAADTDCTDLTGTSKSRTLVAADVGKHIRGVVTAVNDADLARSHATTTTSVGGVAPASQGAPVVLPDRAVTAGESLTVSDENFSGTNVTYTYSWMRCPTANPSTTSNPCQFITYTSPSDTYTTTTDDIGQHVRVMVQGSNSAGSDESYSTTRLVNAAGAGAGTAPARTADPAIDPAGAVTEGDTLTMTSPGAFGGTPVPAVTHQWQRCGGTAAAPTGCSAISGATGASYTTGASDTGKVVRVRARAENAAGSATADSSAREVREKAAAAKVERPTVGPAPAGGGAAGGPTGPAFSTRGTDKMPNVLGKTADEAIAAIAAAGIFADVVVNAQARTKPLKLNGKALDPGQVHSQSTGAGTAVVSSISAKHKVRLVVEAGKPGIKGCQESGFRSELKGVTLEQAWELFEAKRCDGKVNLNFKVAGSEDEPEVQSASKDGKELRVTVVLPRSHAEMDLFPTKSQGAFPSDPMPSFGVDDWALTADVDNIFGVKVYDRYIGDGRRNTGGRVGVGAQVYVDGDRVGVEDEVRKTRGDTGDAAIFSRFRPDRAGTVIYLVQMQDAAGQKIFGYGHFKVKQRSGTFSTIAGETYSVAGGRATRAGRAAGGPVARAASVNQLFSWVQGLFQSTPLQNLAAGARTASEGLVSLAKKSAGAVQFALGSISSTSAQLIRMQAANVVASGGGNVVSAGGANVVSAGGANVVAAGGANVVSAGGANVVSAGGANVVAAGGMNLLGQAKLVNGTGSLRMIPNDAKLLSDNGLGLISDNGLGLRGASKVIAPAEGAPVVAAGGLNLIGSAAGNILAQNNAGIIGSAAGN